MTTKTEDQPLPDMPEPEQPIEEPWDELAALAIQLRCAHCGSASGEWCRTRTGHGAANLHAARLLVVQSCFWLGYEHGNRAGRWQGEQRALEGDG